MLVQQGSRFGIKNSFFPLLYRECIFLYMISLSFLPPISFPTGASLGNKLLSQGEIWGSPIQPAGQVKQDTGKALWARCGRPWRVAGAGTSGRGMLPCEQPARRSPCAVQCSARMPWAARGGWGGEGRSDILCHAEKNTRSFGSNEVKLFRSSVGTAADADRG